MKLALAAGVVLMLGGLQALDMGKGSSREMIRLERQMISEIQSLADEARRTIEATCVLCDVALDRCRASRQVLVDIAPAPRRM